MIYPVIPRRQFTVVRYYSADIRQGKKRDAILYSVGANASHGLRRTNEDKRRAVMLLLEDDEWKLWSNREIARRCTVSYQLVNDIRKELSLSDSGCQIEQQERKVERNGTIYTQNTSNIGKHKVEFEQFLQDNHDKIHEVLSDNPVTATVNKWEEPDEEPKVTYSSSSTGIIGTITGEAARKVKEDMSNPNVNRDVLEKWIHWRQSGGSLFLFCKVYSIH